MWDTRQITYPLLREVGKGIRVHGNGFIQLDVGENQRIHVWGFDDVSRQRVSTQIHNHRFDFRSTLLAGRLENRHYSIFRVWEPDDRYYRLYCPSAIGGEETKLVRGADSEMVHALFEDTEVLFPGMTYRMNHGDYHESVPHELSITLLTKTAAYPAFCPAVLVRLGAEPDNNFKRTGFDEETLWGIVRQACEKIA